MANVTVTARELKNKHTGLDIYVPKYNTIPGPLGGTVMYHVIVVTRLFYFKTQGKYKESDVVQFMIPQKFSTFEELYHKLVQKFSSVVFSPLPRKALIVNDSVINDRIQTMEDVLQQIAKTPKLACSSLTLEFLGVHTQKDGTPLDERDSCQDQQKEKPNTDDADDIDLFATDQQEPKQPDGDDDKDNDDDDSQLFAKAAKPTFQGTSIFQVEDKEDDLDNLFIPAGALEKKSIKLEIEDNSELLHVDDDLDKLLNISKPNKPPKPSVLKPPVLKPPVPKPSVPKPPVPKPRTKSKPQLKPKPALKPRFHESKGNAEEELFAVSSKKSEQDTSEDLFARPRKSSFRKESADEDTLDDIFKKPAKSIFPSAEDDDDSLFKTSSDMNADDISNYIQQSLKDDKDSLDLF